MPRASLYIKFSLRQTSGDETDSETRTDTQEATADSATRLKPSEISGAPWRRKRKNVRSGCLTCKVRKVKCDEAKPECQRCRSTGRNCDGYLPDQSTPASQETINSKASSIPSSQSTQLRPGNAFEIFQTPQNHPVARKEMYTFEFVRVRSLPALSGYFSAGFWSPLLTNPNRLEPTLWHAVLAIGSFHEESEIQRVFPWQRHPDESPKRNMAFALYHYTAAIRHLRAKIESENPSLSVILTACILFVYLEFLRGDLEAATAQIHSGLNIIRDPIRKKPTGKPSSSLELQKNASDSLIPQFYSLGIFGTLFGRPTTPALVYGEYQQPPTNGFKSLTEARLAIMQLISVIVPYVQAATIRYAYLKANPTNSSHAEKLKLESHLERWLEEFNRLIESLRTNGLHFSDSRAAQVLMVQHTIASIWVKASFATTECAFDSYSVDFAKIVLLSEAITSPDPKQQTSKYHDLHASSFSFELGIIPALYWTAVKCRDPIIRRRAVYLMVHKTARQEGLWFAKETASVASRVIELEEGRSWDTKLENEKQQWPPESARVRRRHTSGEDPLPTWGRIKEITISDMTILRDSPLRGRYVTFEMWDSESQKPRLQREYIKYIDCD